MGLHVAVALKRTWDISLNYSVASGKLNMAISGVTLLTFMTIHLFQFRFGDTKPYDLCPPEYLVNIGLECCALVFSGWKEPATMSRCATSTGWNSKFSNPLVGSCSTLEQCVCSPHTCALVGPRSWALRLLASRRGIRIRRRTLVTS